MAVTWQYLKHVTVPQPTTAIAVILTALPVEYDAVRAHLTDTEELVHPDGTRVERGRLDGTSWNIAIAELGEGALNTAALTTRIVDWLAPEALLFVGVAGGLKDDIEIGDVVVGTKVYAIHGGKQTPEGFQARPEVWHGSHRLVQAARSALRDMPDVRAHRKPIAVGDVVLADDKSALAAHIRHHYNDACAIEMEGSGAAHASYLKGQLDTLVIRGISDRANADKHVADASGSQELAAKQARRWPSPCSASTCRAATPPASPSPVIPRRVPYEAVTAGPPTAETTSTSAAEPSTGLSQESRSDDDGTTTLGTKGTVHGPVPVATSTLPPRPLGFTGRSAELGRLLPHLAPAGVDETALPSSFSPSPAWAASARRHSRSRWATSLARRAGSPAGHSSWTCAVTTTTRSRRTRRSWPCSTRSAYEVRISRRRQHASTTPTAPSSSSGVTGCC